MNHLQNKSRQERIEILTANANKREEFSYFKPFTEDELHPYKERFFECKADVDLAQASLDEAKEHFKQVTAEPVQECKECYAVIRAKGKQVKEEVYLIANQESGIMEYINEAGEIVFSRRLLPAERQTMLKAVND